MRYSAHYNNLKLLFKAWLIPFKYWGEHHTQVANGFFFILDVHRGGQIT